MGTAWPGKQLQIRLPGDRGLSYAEWHEAGTASYHSDPVDYLVIPDAGGGVNIRLIRKHFISPSDFVLGVRPPEGTRLRQEGHAVVVETVREGGSGGEIIGAFTIPEARDANGAPISVSPSIGPGPNPAIPHGLVLNMGPVDLLAFPVTATISYKVTTSVPPVTATPPAAETPDASGAAPAECVTGPSEHHGEGKVADFRAACGTFASCMQAVPEQTTAITCENTFMGDLTAACVATFGHDGPAHDACLGAANAHVRWAKENLIPGQPVGAGASR